MLGTVQKYNRIEAFGFIIPDDPTLPDFFVCYQFIEGVSKHNRFLIAGQRVEFEPAEIDTKPQAHHVHKIGPVTVAVQRSAPPSGESR